MKVQKKVSSRHTIEGTECDYFLEAVSLLSSFRSLRVMPDNSDKITETEDGHLDIKRIFDLVLKKIKPTR
jgi:hypothetical protein